MRISDWSSDMCSSDLPAITDAIMTMDQQAQLRWFARDVLPHEGDLRKWLGGRIRGLHSCDIDEVVQEAYARLWPSDRDAIRNAHAYLFVKARPIFGEHRVPTGIWATPPGGHFDSRKI